ncbi:DUF317 domain-containing protein [Streptomyces sp. NPDC004324]
MVSPDDTAYVQQLGSAEEPGAWFVTATLGPNRPVWQSHFGAHTPPHLVAAFTTALADPNPVYRTAGARSADPEPPPRHSQVRRRPRRLRRRRAGGTRPVPCRPAQRHANRPAPSRQAPSPQPGHSR